MRNWMVWDWRTQKRIFSQYAISCVLSWKYFAFRLVLFMLHGESQSEEKRGKVI